MSLGAPYWLIGLLAWGVFALWVLWGRRKRVDVPFLELWRGPVEGPKARRGVRLPPVGLAAVLGGMLLAIVAAARPGVRRAGVGGRPIAILVDHGLSMSAGAAGQERYRQLVAAVAGPVMEAFGEGAVELVGVPGGGLQRTDRGGWAALAGRLAPTALETRTLLPGVIAEELARGAGPVLVLSDQALDGVDPRVLRIAPESAIANVGIVRFSANEAPGVAPQVMLRLRNESGLGQANLRLLVDERPIRSIRLDLPGQGRERDYFFEVPEGGRVLVGQLEVKDDLGADNRAALVRQPLWPRVEARSALPAELGRLMAGYGRLRPASEGSRRVALATSLEALLPDEAGAVVEAGAGGASGELRVEAHPITRAVERWPGAAGGAALEEGGWRPLVSVGGRWLVAVRSAPARQVWVGMDISAWAATPDFVIFWTNVLDWLGEGGEGWTAESVGRLAEGWEALEGWALPAGTEAGLWPGLYRRGDGALRAVNALDVRLGTPGLAEWRSELLRLAGREPAGPEIRPLAPGLLLGALGLMVVAAATWRRAVR